MNQITHVFCELSGIKILLKELAVALLLHTHEVTRDLQSPTPVGMRPEQQLHFPLTLSSQVSPPSNPFSPLFLQPGSVHPTQETVAVGRALPQFHSLLPRQLLPSPPPLPLKEASLSLPRVMLVIPSLLRCCPTDCLLSNLPLRGRGAVQQ